MSGYLTHSVSSTGNRKIFTISAWVKVNANTVNQTIFGAGTAGSNSGKFYFAISNGVVRIGGGANVYRVTGTKLRDPASWYHLVCAVDTTQAGASSDRIKLYINGVQETDFTTTNYTSQDQNTPVNESGKINTFGAEQGGGESWDGYMTHMVLVDGAQLTASNFGETDSTTGEWKPKADPTGVTYGTNGVFMKCENSGNFGLDSSGQGNNYTANSFPTGAFTTDSASNNFAVFNPLIAYLDAGSNPTKPTFSQGNLKTVTTNSGKLGGTSTFQINKGKWYAEFKFVESNNAGSTIESVIGVTDSPQRLSAQFGKPGERAHDVAYIQNGNKLIGDSSTSFGASYTDGDIIGVAVDLDNNAIYFSKNGVFQNSGDPTSGSTKTGAIALTDPDSTVEGGYYFAVGEATSETSTHQANFGNAPFSISSGNSDGAGFGNFEYAVPSGYYALCTRNLNTYG